VVPVAAEIQVYRNDQLSWRQVAQLEPDAVVISPGPGRLMMPVSLDLIAE